ncbi:MAG TPA: alpha-hydroxy acid oxidase [Steroidobacteraceae bacterium]|jgi:L-lactate dehydrogenase (cytochrome)|nr:alpha-hydroxy acid oxidase [Steroidobacteraceae bacterium]
MSVINSIEDLRALARRRVPRALFDYVDRGAYDEQTLRRNRTDLDALQFRQRIMVDLSTLSLESTLLGAKVAMPLAIGPIGLGGFVHGDGEIHGARAAAAFGVPFCLSTLSICSIEDVRAAVPQPFWFQVYLMRDRGFNQELIARARAAQCSVLVLTVDLPIQGLRRRDAKNGLTVPPRLTLRNAVEIALRPRWALGVLLGKRRTFGNLASHLANTGGLSTLSQWIATQFDRSVSWKDIEWLRQQWPGRLIVKGILDAEDALAACAAGVDGIIVSNHGGRQLDGAPSSIAVLPEVVAAVAGRCEVLFDGGIRSGQDMLKALALGARGCLIGKAYMYALGAQGGAGVTRALGILRDELQVSLALTGRTNLAAVDRSILRAPQAGAG